jgi:hypothetical protein
MLLALDPGMNSPGVALFQDATLFRAGRVPIPAGYATLSAGARWMHVARLVVRWLCSESGVNHVDNRMITTVVFEKPQWYQRSKSKGDPNDLVGVAGVAANVTGILSTHNEIQIFSPTPAEWIGQVPKICPICKGKKTKPADPDFARAMRAAAKRKKPLRVKTICPECNSSAWGTPRGKRIRPRLSPAELALVPDQNDAIDAVGIGLWALGRLEPVSVVSNGRDGR